MGTRAFLVWILVCAVGGLGLIAIIQRAQESGDRVALARAAAEQRVAWTEADVQELATKRTEVVRLTAEITALKAEVEAAVNVKSLSLMLAACAATPETSLRPSQ